MIDILTGVRWTLGVLLVWVLLMAKDVEHPLRCLLTICTSSFVSSLFSSMAPVSVAVCFLAGFLHILLTELILCQMCIWHTQNGFLPILQTSSSHDWQISFAVQMLFNFMTNFICPLLAIFTERLVFSKSLYWSAYLEVFCLLFL